VRVQDALRLAQQRDAGRFREVEPNRRLIYNPRAPATFLLKSH
jgi:hypothetical protein